MVRSAFGQAESSKSGVVSGRLLIDFCLYLALDVTSRTGIKYPFQGLEICKLNFQVGLSLHFKLQTSITCLFGVHPFTIESHTSHISIRPYFRHNLRLVQIAP